MTTRIDSPSNPRIQAAVKAIASGEAMLLEGRRMIEEALEAGVSFEELFVQEEEEKEEDFLRKGRGAGDARATAASALATSASARATHVSTRVLRRLSDLPSTKGVVALAKPPHRTLASLSSLLPSKKTASSNPPREAAIPRKRGSETEGPLFLVLDDVQDPTNVGAILRSGEAFGAAAALLTPGCAWPFSPRALRASAGSALRLPVCARVTAREAVAWARRLDIALAGAEAHGGDAPESLAAVRPLALVIGSEGRGISPDIAAALDHRITLPLAGRVESLNAAVAAGVLLHVLTRRPASLR
jgi:TrmH family RNA methyltransferase